jgi:predicted metal-dependent enzyme (double-stranded beta helix superfamily)
MSSRVSIDDFAKRLAEIPQAEFTHSKVLQFTRSNVVDCESLNPYLWFSDDHYTRNLILKTDLFELIAICWEVGQKSPIHNHRDQNCWMAIPYGKLQVHNFALVQKNSSTGFCELRSSGQILIDPENPTEVDPEEPIHQVLNLSSFGSKAVSLHIYSRPFDSCEVYDLKEKRYQDVPLINTTEYGKLVDNSLRCQKFSL